jgi:hypothetical protein
MPTLLGKFLFLPPDSTDEAAISKHFYLVSVLLPNPNNEEPLLLGQIAVQKRVACRAGGMGLSGDKRDSSENAD